MSGFGAKLLPGSALGGISHLDFRTGGGCVNGSLILFESCEQMNFFDDDVQASDTTFFSTSFGSWSHRLTRFRGGELAELDAVCSSAFSSAVTCWWASPRGVFTFAVDDVVFFAREVRVVFVVAVEVVFRGARFFLGSALAFADDVEVARRRFFLFVPSDSHFGNCCSSPSNPLLICHRRLRRNNVYRTRR